MNQLPNSSEVLSVNNLSKSYGNVTAVDDISFNIRKGEIVGLLGPNGAGKTTTINMLLSVLSPSKGSIKIKGIDLLTDRSKALQETNFAAIYAPLPGNLTVYHNLKIFGLLYDVKDLNGRIETILKQLNIEKFRNAKCGTLSSGEQTRVCLAKAMLNSPELLLLDEPTASLDPATARDIRLKIRDFTTEGICGVLWTSHNMSEVEQVCDRVLFMSQGKILLGGDPKTLASEYNKVNLEELFIAVAREPLSLDIS